jgi:hypothetical protein
MRSRVIRASWVALAALAVAGCNSDIRFEEGEVAPPAPPGDPSSVTLLVSSPQIPSSATSTTSGVRLLATVRDANQNNVSGVQVSFSTPDTGMNITVVSATTDTNGLAEAILTVFSNKANRSVTVTATVQTAAGPVSQSVNVSVIGTSIALSGPSSGQAGTAASYTATLTDAAGAGIANAAMTFASTAAGSFTPSASATTNSSGQATVSFTPGTTSTSTTISATALGITATQAVTVSTDIFSMTAPTAGQEIPVGTAQNVTVTWSRGGAPVNGATITFASTRGTLSAFTATTAGGTATVTINSAQAGLASITATGDDGTTTVTASLNVEFVATTPATVVLQPDPTTLSVGATSTLRAVVRDAASNFVKNQTINFKIDQGPGSLSAATAVTNSQGTAVVTYTATATSGAGGVIVRATVGNTAITDTETITVGGNALRVVLGTGNSIQEPSPTLYSVPYSVIVTDSNGSAVSNKRVTLSLHALNYYKGTSAFAEPSGPWFRIAPDGSRPIECRNEDTLSPDQNFHFDGIMNDPVNEDLDGDGRLDPENIGSVPSSVTTNDQGVANFDVVYTQDRAGWVQVRLRATLGVDGSEGVTDTVFVLTGTASDFNNRGVAPPGFDSPYGVLQDCTIDDTKAPTVQFQVSSQSGIEDDAAATTGTVFTVVVTATPASGATITQNVVVPLSYGSGAGTATRNTDYTAPDSVTIAAGTSQNSFTVTMIPDASAESIETIPITLQQPTNALRGNRRVHTITVNDND